jgi:hypothetical protein
VVSIVGVVAIAVATAASAAAQGDVLVSTGVPSDPTYKDWPFSQNKQNEPAVAINQAPGQHNVLAAGSNDELDMEACNAGPDDDCPFTEGVGTSGIYFSFDNGDTWSQPRYTGWSGRDACQGVVGDDDPPCDPDHNGPIGTLPRYDEAGLVSDGDPALAFGPVPDDNGHFDWENGSRLYYANLAAHLPGTNSFKGAEAIAVSRTDDVASAAAGNESAWKLPVIASRQSSAQFSDKEQIWADNASSSKFFGNAYVCYADFRGNGKGFTNQPLMVVTSRDGGDTWSQTQVTSATNNINSRNGFGRSGCTVRTDSNGVVYVFTYQFGFNATAAAAGFIQMVKSFDGGKHWTRPANIFQAFDTCNYFEPSIGRCVEDGVAGARSDLSPAPSVDIANGAPEGNPTGPTANRIVISWVDGRDGLNHEHVMFSQSGNGGSSWQAPQQVEQPPDRGYYSAPSISPNGRHTWIVYNAFDTPFREMATGPGNDRRLTGVVLHAATPASAATPPGFAELHRVANPGDARASSQNDLAAEFLGDYVYSAATNDYSMSVWNDVRNGDDCSAVDAYRQALHDEAEDTGGQTAEAEEPRGEEDRRPNAKPEPEESGPEPPDVQQECVGPERRFGNSDIYGASIENPPAP